MPKSDKVTAEQVEDWLNTATRGRWSPPGQHTGPALAALAEQVTYLRDLLRQTDDPLGVLEAERMVSVRRHALALGDELAALRTLWEENGDRVPARLGRLEAGIGAALEWLATTSLPVHTRRDGRPGGKQSWHHAVARLKPLAEAVLEVGGVQSSINNRRGPLVLLLRRALLEIDGQSRADSTVASALRRHQKKKAKVIHL